MAKIREFKFTYPNGYAAIHTPECVARINDPQRGRGCIPYRYHIIQRDGTGETVVIANITRPTLVAYRKMASEQGNVIW